MNDTAQENQHNLQMLQKKCCSHGMTGDECKYLHPPLCEKYMENPERRCRAQCKGYHPELCKYSMTTRECSMIDATEYVSKAQCANKPSSATYEPYITPQTTNRQ